MWNKKNLLSVDQLSRGDIEFILNCSKILEPLSGRGNKLNICKGEILAEIFFEPSTRTEKSFQAAMYTLGGEVILHKDPGSSREKGESKEDTVKMFEQYSDIIVVRDPEIGLMKKYADLVNIPLINAGDGANEHPSQALLDLYTINKEIGRLDDITMVLMADIKYARAVHSLLKALRKFSSNKIYGISPKGLEMPGIEMIDIDELKRVNPDILYVTRIQKERIPTEERDKFAFRVDARTLSLLSSHTRIMHPLPRIDEIDPAISNDNRFIFFKQVRNGLHTRMAIISILMGHEDEVLAIKDIHKKN
ncbi:MAG: aspartate carbamoyltransferase [Candidatus Aenigmarchaeota archaeon]|nr:aspartate carbamoyltransferase [Candidatus Aenigmarchaeota archaeon]